MMDAPWTTLAASITRLGDRIDALPTVREATIATITPLAVKFDTDTDPTVVQGSLAASVAVGYRVLTLKLRHYIWILGVKGGDTPAGAGMEWLGTTPPAGWLLQNGAVLLRADYPALYNAVGTLYNTGGETGLQFRLPNRAGKVGVGLDTGQTEFNALGKTGGEKAHTLTTAEMPAHTHGAGANSDGFAAHATGGSGFSAVLSNAAASGEAYFYRLPDNAGGGAAHNNLSPYLTLNYIIKT